MVVEQTSQGISNGIRLSVVDVPKMVSSIRFKKRSSEPPEKNKGDGTQPSYVVMFVAELIGTGLLMFLGCMGCVSQYDEPTPTHHMGGISFGLTVMIIIQVFGHISGAHLNPAVTLATVIFGMLKPLMGLVYIVAQFVGATLGYGLLKILISDNYVTEGFCATTVNSKISSVQGLGIEIVISTVLILICCAVWDKRNADKPDSVPLRFGLAISAISMVAGPLTGASMNTARSFAPLVFGGSWKDHWIYWLGPTVAAPIGCGLYKILFAAPDSEEGSKSENSYLEELAGQTSEKV